MTMVPQTLDTVVKKTTTDIFNKGKVVAVLAAAAATAVVVSAVLGATFLSYNNEVRYSSERGLAASKATFLTGGHTELNIDKGGKVTIYHVGSFLDSTEETFRDDNGDGRVDFFSDGSKTFVREIDGQRFPLIFKNADKDYAEQMKRFESVINRYIR